MNNVRNPDPDVAAEYRSVLATFDQLIEELEFSSPSLWSPLQRHDVRYYFEQHLTNILFERGFYCDDDLPSQK